mmetsp:Transcript_35239/g.51722  ORF Transcript_35239/g.51722 Transcript_35239/m.51722 type:complete len:472 (+) Transcript_35239:107-1522(+)
MYTNMYVARTLSFEQASFQLVDVPTSDQQKQQYNACAQLIRAMIEHGVLVKGLGPKSWKSVFWSACQRIFAQLILAFKVGTACTVVKQAIKEGKCVVIGLVSTGEASVARANESDDMDHEMSSTAAENLTNLLDRARSNSRAADRDDWPSETQHKEFKKKIQDLKLPVNPLDDLIDRLGGTEKVAEMTGRKMRYVKNGHSWEYAERKKDNIGERKLFQEGTKLIAIISEAASSGISLHSDRRVKNQRRRVHLTIQLPWSADQAVQQMGRTHRSNQSSAPEFKLLMCKDVRGESRFASAVAQRLQDLGALTRGDRTAAVGCNGSIQPYCLESKYAMKALTELQRMIDSKKPTQTFDSLPAEKYGSAEGSDDASFYAELDIDALEYVDIFGKLKINKFLNRLLNLDLKQQTDIFNLFELLIQEFVEDAKRTGLYEGSGVREIVGTHSLVPKKRNPTALQRWEGRRNQSRQLLH